MPNVSLDLLGESYVSRDKPLDNQSTVNMYPEQSITRRGGLMSWPGKTLKVAALANDRGIYDFEGTYLQVCDTSLYSVDMIGFTRTLIGTIPGYNRCTFASNSGVCVIANGSGLVYQYDGSTLSLISDPDLETPLFVDHLNNQIIFSNNKTTPRWVVGDAGDFDSIQSNNYAAAESSGDILIRPYVFRQQLWLFGTKTIEPWWNSGSGNPPFDRLEGGIIEKGLGADYSIASSDEVVFFLGDDLKVYHILGGEIVSISTDGIWYEISQYTSTADAVGAVIQVGNQDIYILQFPSEGKTWAYSQQKQFWFNLSSGAQGEKYDASSFVYANNKWYVSGEDGAIYQLNYTDYTENNSDFVRERVTRDFDSEYFGESDREVFWNSIKMRWTVGKGVADTSPMATIEVSDNSGENWSQLYQFDLGELGERDLIHEIHGLGNAWRRKFRIRCTDNVDFNLYEMKANVELGI